MNQDKPTELTEKDIDKCIDFLKSQYLCLRTCFKCSHEFMPNYDIEYCDECFFNRFPEKIRNEYFKKIFHEVFEDLFQ